MRSSIRSLAVCLAAFAALVPAAAFAVVPDVPASRFMTSDGCGCHAAFVEQWSKTMHSKALSDPLYLYKLAQANRATGGKLGEFCEDCHGPIAAMSNTNGAAAKDRSPVAREGVVCDFCHQLVGTAQPPANNSWVIKADGVKKAQFDDARSPAHQTAYSAYHEKAEFCGACHNVNHPANGLPLEATYTEWKNGPYAAEGITCQDCHMTPGPGVTKPNPGKAAGFGPDRPHIYTMTFAGANVGLGDAVLAEERLKGAATLKVETPEFVAEGQAGTATVTVTNSGAGHYLPTGVTEVRECWLAITVTGPDGAVLAEQRADFHTQLKGADGRGPVELWDAVGVLSDTRIPPRQAKDVDVAYTMPAGGSKVDVTAALYYRSASEKLAAEAGVDIPTTEMASTHVAVYSSPEAAAKASTEGALKTPGDGSTPLVILLLGMGAIGGVLGIFWLRARLHRRPEA